MRRPELAGASSFRQRGVGCYGHEIPQNCVVTELLNNPKGTDTLQQIGDFIYSIEAQHNLVKS